MDQPTPSYTPADLERIVARDFDPAEAPNVRAILARYDEASGQPETLRVQMACLKLADGDLGELERAVEIACGDYRDVLAAAEYRAFVEAPTAEAEEAAIASDWEQLQAWLHRA